MLQRCDAALKQPLKPQTIHISPCHSDGFYPHSILAVLCAWPKLQELLALFCDLPLGRASLNSLEQPKLGENIKPLGPDVSALAIAGAFVEALQFSDDKVSEGRQAYQLSRTVHAAAASTGCVSACWTA
ncbi:hypothetical protein KNHN1_56450 (plasmid) [Pseudomonas guariconensis]